MYIAAIIGAAAGLLIFAIRPFVLGFYNITEVTHSYAMSFMAITSVLVFFMAQLQRQHDGRTLRGGGDGKFVMVIDVIFMWMICIPLGYIAGLRLGMSAPIVYFIIKCDEMIKSVIGAVRVYRGRWIRDMTV